MKPPTPVPCPIEAPKFTLPVRFSFTVKTTSTSPSLPAGRTSGGGSGVSKKPRFAMLCQLRISRSRLNTAPGTVTSCRRMHASSV